MCDHAELEHGKRRCKGSQHFAHTENQTLINLLLEGEEHIRIGILRREHIRGS